MAHAVLWNTPRHRILSAGVTLGAISVRMFSVGNSKSRNSKTLSSSSSSKRWKQRHVSDPYVQKATKENKVARSYYKLQQLDDRFKLFRGRNLRVVDLGAAPGGWTSYILEQKDSKTIRSMIAVDLLPLHGDLLGMEKDLSFFHFLMGDITKVQDDIVGLLPGGKATVVLSDMAPNFCGDAKTDSLRAIGLCEIGLDLGLTVLDKDGWFVGKYFSGEGDREMVQYAREYFTKVQVVKPPASRKESSEHYLVCGGFKTASDQR